MKKLFLIALFIPAVVTAAAEPTFFDRATGWIARHPETGIADFPALVKKMTDPCAPATAFDTAVLPRHKVKTVRVWGTELLETFRTWGLDVAEFNPNKLGKGEVPDVVFLTQAPGYFHHDVEVMYRAAAEGVNFVALDRTDLWSMRIARRLGFKYDGVLTIGGPVRGGSAFTCVPQLATGFPKDTRLDAFFAPIYRANRMHGMYLTGEECLMGVVDVGQGRVATAIARYRIGRGSFILVGPGICKLPNEPITRRLILNLIDLCEKPAGPVLNLPCVYHPTPPEGKPYFELNVPGEKFEYLTQARPPDHAWHLGCFFSWRYINGVNFWDTSAGKIGRTRVVSHRETGDGTGAAVLTSVLAYEVDGKTILRETRTVKVLPRAKGAYALDWTADFEAVEPLVFTADRPIWNKAKGTDNGGGFAGLCARLGRNCDFEFAYRNDSKSRDARCFGDRGMTIEVAAKSKRTGSTAHLRWRADRPTPNYTLYKPQVFAPHGFYFLAFPECFAEPLKMAKGEKRHFHYVIEVE